MDSFISGWEEGGELNALISVKCNNKSKVTEIRAQLEAEVGTPALSSHASGKAEIDKSAKSAETETTISAYPSVAQGHP